MWLTDKHISAVNKILREQHPQQNGLQDTLALTVKLQRTSNCTNFVQILNIICEQYWVAMLFKYRASRRGCYYLRQYTCLFNWFHYSQKADYRSAKNPSLKLQFRCAKAGGGGDCTLFAIVNTVTLCLGQSRCPLIRYNQRSHLFESFQQGKLTLFPGKENPHADDETTTVKYNRSGTFNYCCCDSPTQEAA